MIFPYRQRCLGVIVPYVPRYGFFSCLYLEKHKNPAVVRLWRELWHKSYASHARHKKRRTPPALISLVSL